MKVKNLLKIGLPIISSSLLVTSAVACSNQDQSSGTDIVHSDGTTTSYVSFEEAMNHAISGDSLLLKGDVTLKSSITMKSLNGITIDGNGHNFNLEETANAESIFYFENCTNLTLTKFGITGGTADAGIKVLNGNINIDNVVVAGQYAYALYLGGNAGANINDSMFESVDVNKSTQQTIYVSGDTTSVVTLNGVVADSIFVDSTLQAKKRVEFKSNCNIRYVRVVGDTSGPAEIELLNTFLSGYKNIINLWFVGFSVEVEKEICLYMSLSDLVKDIQSFYIVTAVGLKQLNDFYKQTLTTHTEFNIQAHLMNDIDYNVEENGYWDPIDSGKTRTSDSDTGDQLSKFTLFDGHGYTISNLQITQGERTTHAVGFFGMTGSVCVKDITFDNCRLEMNKGPNGLQNAGMVFGRVTGSAKLLNVTVSNSYIGARQKAASLVGLIDSGRAIADSASLDLKLLACVEISACVSENNQIVNKSTGDADGVDVYLAGLVGWLNYHSVNEATGNVTHSGYMIIDDDPAKTTYLIDPHFNWQQEVEDWDTRFEVALLFLYGRMALTDGTSNYRQCNSYNNVVVKYSGE